MSLQDRLKALFEKTNEEQERFLHENKAKEGVVVLPSGLQYLVLHKGEGEKPGADSLVTVHYEGSLINGKVFDSSYRRGAPATFVYSFLSWLRRTGFGRFHTPAFHFAI